MSANGKKQAVEEVDLRLALGFALRSIIEGRCDKHTREWALVMVKKYGV